MSLFPQLRNIDKKSEITPIAEQTSTGSKKTDKVTIELMNDPRFKDYENKSLDELLNGLSKFGKHRLSWMGDGWHCAIDMYVNVTGTELKISSEFYHQTHKNAVIQCIIRINDTIAKINNLKD